MLVSVVLAMLVPSSAAADGFHDKTPLTCDGKPAAFHVDRSFEVIDKGYVKPRVPDKTPLKAREKDALRSHKLCLRSDERHARIEAHRDRAAKQYKAWLASEWPSPESVGVSSSTLAAIRECESGGNYATDTGNGFYGAYQFTLSTWASVGGSGNPAAASKGEQDYRAALLYAREGSSPWPVCGQ